MVIKMELGELPWTGVAVRIIHNLTDHFRDTTIGKDCRYLPKSITLFVELELEQTRVHAFLERMVQALESEIQARLRRIDVFEKLQLFERDEIESLLTQYTGTQAWGIYYGMEGGLGADNRRSRDYQAVRGVIPCSTMRNHGVAWKLSENGFDMWLATTRKEGQDWDWDSDIGHESGHAAFAPVPLFVQSANLLKGMLHVDDLRSSKDLQPKHIARITYAFSEMTVTAIRGEGRPTETGTPLGQPTELLALLKFSHELMPKIGFDRAACVYERTSGYVDVENGTEIYEIVAPMLRVIPQIKGIMNSFIAPTVEEFSNLVGQIG